MARKLQKQRVIEDQKKESSRIYSLFYSFFLIPFMIAIFGAVFFLLFRFITYETTDASELLNQVKIGSATKRWQSAYELSKVLNDPDAVPFDLSFKNQMVSAYDHAINDDPLVRAYLAIAMGATGDQYYGDKLVLGLNDESRESRLAAIQAVGMVKEQNAISRLSEIIKSSDFQDERLAATMSLGFIGNSKSIPLLNSLLNDDEPNIRWDAAIGLAKMGEDSSIPTIQNLMDRNYLSTFPELDQNEVTKVILTAIETTTIIVDQRFEPLLETLASSDENLKVRNAAIKTLKFAYNKNT